MNDCGTCKIWDFRWAGIYPRGTGISDAGLRSSPSPTIEFTRGQHLKVAIRVGGIVMTRCLSFGPPTSQLAVAVKPSSSVIL